MGQEVIEYVATTGIASEDAITEKIHKKFLLDLNAEPGVTNKMIKNGGNKIC